MPEVNDDFICRYVCGECDYDEVTVWSVHNTHYYNHRRNDAN